jgi:hypothetical protein
MKNHLETVGQEMHCLISLSLISSPSCIKNEKLTILAVCGGDVVEAAIAGSGAECRVCAEKRGGPWELHQASVCLHTEQPAMAALQEGQTIRLSRHYFQVCFLCVG